MPYRHFLLCYFVDASAAFDTCDRALGFCVLSVLLRVLLLASLEAEVCVPDIPPQRGLSA